MFKRIIIITINKVIINFSVEIFSNHACVGALFEGGLKRLMTCVSTSLWRVINYTCFSIIDRALSFPDVTSKVVNRKYVVYNTYK